MFKAITAALKDGAKEGTQKEISENLIPNVAKGVCFFGAGFIIGMAVTNARWTKAILMEVIKK